MSVPPEVSGTQSRVRWRERQPLRSNDLATEQDSRLVLRRRHARSAHEWGIVTGLALAEGADAFLIQPGVAVDGYGRSLVVPVPIVIPEATVERLIEQAGAAAVDVWLLYGRATATPPQRGRYECGPGRHSRWHEEARVRLRAIRNATAPVDARHPVEVPAGDVPFGPERIPPDDPEREWPVYLGRLERGTNGYTVHLDRRPYAGLVGEAVVSPTGDARMQVGGELPGNPLRFAIAASDAGESPTDRLTIDHQSRVEVHGDTTLDGDLRLAATPNSAPALDFRPLPEPPAAAAPWQLYQVKTTTETGPTKLDELRFEIGNPGDKGDPSRYRLTIGSLDADEKFSSCLAVRADCVVTVHGTLSPETLVVQGPARADPGDPRFGDAVTKNWLEGLEQAAARLGVLIPNTLKVQITGFPPGPAKAENQLPHTVTVTNHGPIRIDSVTVTEAFAANGVPVTGGGLVLNPTILPPGGSVSAQFGPLIPQSAADKTLSVLVAAAGSMPSGRPVQAFALARVQVEKGHEA